MNIYTLNLICVIFKHTTTENVTLYSFGNIFYMYIAFVNLDLGIHQVNKQVN